MWRDTIFLAKIELWRLVRVRETILWTFFMPLVFIYFIGIVQSNNAGDRGDGIGVLVSEGAGPLADQLIHELERRDFQIFPAKSAAELAGYYRQLEIPSGFTDAVERGEVVKLHFTRPGGDLGADFDQVRLARAVAPFGRGKTSTPLATIDVHFAGRRPRPPSGFEQSAPGTMVMFTLTVLFTVGGVSLVMERNKGIFRRLASSPMSRGSVVAGMWGARMGLGLIQIAYAMAASAVLFRVHWTPHLPAIALVLVSYAALATALGMLLGNLCETDGQVIGIGVMGANILAGLGGCWWPIEIAPPWSRKLALGLPTGVTMDAMHKLMSFGLPSWSVFPHVCGLAAAALITGWIVTKTFRYQ